MISITERKEYLNILCVCRRRHYRHHHYTTSMASDSHRKYNFLLVFSVDKNDFLREKRARGLIRCYLLMLYKLPTLDR